MKKISILGFCLLTVMNAGAQNSKFPQAKIRVPNNINRNIGAKQSSKRHSAERITSVPFVTETFGGGTSTTLPTGWTTGSLSGSSVSWQWRLSGDASGYGIGEIKSTTASNGFMMYNSDSIGTDCSCASSGWLQSPAYNCASHSSVQLTFEEYYESFFDSCEVWVGTNSSFTAGTYNAYKVAPNFRFGGGSSNGETSGNIFTENPCTVHLNISAAAASQPNVYIRFVYFSGGSAYSWMIDDMSLSDVPAIDLAAERTNILFCKECNSAWSTTGSIPIILMDSLYPITYISNYGQTNESSDTVNATIYYGSGIVYNQNMILSNINLNGYDSSMLFGNLPGFYSNVPGIYMLVCNVIKSGDADISNNTDTLIFSISDSVMSQNPLNSTVITPDTGITCPALGAWVHNSSISEMVSVGYNIANNLSDTLTSVTVRFDPSTEAGQIVGVQLYKGYFADTPRYVASTEFRPLTATEISSGNSVFAFPSGITPLVTGDTRGTNYFAVVKCDGCTGNVIVSETFDYLYLEGSQSIFDFNHPSNDGDSTHLFCNNLSGNYYINSIIPMINLNFGKNALKTPIITANGNSIGKPYPNPANNQLNLPLIFQNDLTITVTLSNMLGQTLKVEKADLTGGVPYNIVIETGDMTQGLYIYTINTGNERYSGTVVIMH